MITIMQEIDSQVLRVENELGNFIETNEVSPIVAYKYLRQWKDIIEKGLKSIEGKTVDMIENSPLEHRDFRVNIRKTYDFKQSQLWNAKYTELEIEQREEQMKEVEKLIKMATDMSHTGGSYVDSDGVIIEPVECKFNKILTYTKGKNSEI